MWATLLGKRLVMKICLLPKSEFCDGKIHIHVYNVSTRVTVILWTKAILNVLAYLLHP
jgi:hypothetical protein